MDPIDRFIASLALTLALGAAGGCKASPKLASFSDLDYGLPVETVDVEGTTLAYIDVGEGPQTLVLIHGLGSYMPAWRNNVAALSEHARVIALDLPGYGQSDKPLAPYSMRYFVAKIRGLLDALGVENPVLVGHSMGGQIAMTYALQHPQEVAGLVLASPAGLETFADGEAKWLANAVTPEFTCLASDESIYVRHMGNFHAMPKDAAFMVDDRIAMRGAAEFGDYCVAVSRSVAGMLDGPVQERLGEITAPTLVSFGKFDNLIPNPFLHGGSTVRLAKREVARIPGASLLVLPKAGHMAHYEQAQAWNDAVLRFVRTLPVPAASELAAVEDGTAPEPEPSRPAPAPEPEGSNPSAESPAPGNPEETDGPQPPSPGEPLGASESTPGPAETQEVPD